MQLKTLLTFFLLLVATSSSIVNAQEWKSDYDSMRVKFNRGEVKEVSEWIEAFLPKYKNDPLLDTIQYFEMVNLLGRSYIRLGYNTNAQEVFQEEIDAIKNNPNKINTKTFASSLYYLGNINYNLKKYDLAEMYMKESLQSRANRNDLPKSKHISLLTSLANIANATGRFDRADTLYNEVLRMAKEYYGVNSVDVGNILNRLGLLNKKLGRYNLAEKYYEDALTAYSKAEGESLNYLEVLRRKGALYQTQGKYADLETIYKKTADVAAKIYGPKSTQYANYLSDLGDLYKTLTRYNEAEPICLKVLQIIEDTVGMNNLEYTKALLNIASLYKLKTDFVQAEMYYQSALSVYEIIVGVYHESYVRALVQLAALYRVVGRVHDAEPLYQRSMEIYHTSIGEENMAFADLLNEYGSYLDEMGSFEAAEKNFKRCLELTEKIKGNYNPNYASTLDNLATLYMNTGQVDKAEPLLLQSAKIRKELLGNKHPMYATSLNNVANLYVTLGRFDNAKKLYTESKNIITEIHGTMNPHYADVLDNLATVFESEGNFEEAERMVLEAKDINFKIYGPNHRNYISTLNNLARIQLNLKKPEEAEKLLKEDIERTKKNFGEDHPDYATAMVNLAELYEFQEKYKEAEPLYEKSMEIRKEKLGINHRKYTETLSKVAGLYTILGEFNKSDALWKSALSNYLREIKLYFPSMSEKEKHQFLKNIYKEFLEFNSYVIARGNNNPEMLSMMYNNQLETKALILNSSNKVRQRILNSKDEQLIKLYKDWLQQKEMLSKIYSLPKAEIDKKGIRIDSIVELANEIERKLSTKSNLFKNSSDTVAQSWQNIQKKLKEGEAAIEIIQFEKINFKQSGIKTDTTIYAALIIKTTTVGAPELVVLANGKDLNTKFVNYYKNVIKFKSDDEYSYLQYWKPISDKLTGIKKVYLSPDGVYNQINLNTLKNTSTGKYLIEEIDIQIVTNTKDLLAKDGVINNRKNMVLFGNPDYTSDPNDPTVVFEKTNFEGLLNPLPGTEKEVNLISGMMANAKWNTQMTLGANAVEKKVKSINNPKVLHIATHGFFEKNVKDPKAKRIGDEEDSFDNPLLRSGLMFAGASVTMYNTKNAVYLENKVDQQYEDGKLTAYEALNMSLDSTDLVVLSACETGLGDVENGEGVYGLQRAFIIAGAKAIILSLWKVDDNTTQKLMTYFYNEWLKNQNNKRLAFKNAQNLLKTEFPDPYYWGAFVIIGK